MSETPEEIVKLQFMLDAATDSLLDASDDEIIEDIQESGGDPVELAEEAQVIFNRALQANRFRRLEKARSDLQQIRDSEAWQGSRNLIPDDATARRTLLDRLMSQSDFPNELTMAFREGEGEFSDEEILTALEDLAELGFFDESST